MPYWKQRAIHNAWHVVDRSLSLGSTTISSPLSFHSPSRPIAMASSLLAEAVCVFVYDTDVILYISYEKKLSIYNYKQGTLANSL